MVVTTVRIIVVKFEEINLKFNKKFEKVQDVKVQKSSEKFDIHIQSQLLSEDTQ